MMRKSVLLALLLLPAALASLAIAAPAVWDTPTISSDTTWSGDVLIRQNVVVSPGATLRITAGTNVLVESGKGIGISVMGRLVVSGKPSEPVAFLPEKPGAGKHQWEGIRLAGGRNAGHSLAGFRISGAHEGVNLTDTAAKVSGATFSGCGAGLGGVQKSMATVDNCTFDGNDVGAYVSLGSEVVVRDSRFTGIGVNGLVVDKGASASVSNSEFSRGKTGVFSLTDSPCRIEGSRFLSLEMGIVARQMGRNSSIARCTFENDATGILAVQFCSAEISESVFQGNKTGMDVREFSVPRIRNNRFEGNQVAVSLHRKSHAEIEANVFFHNRNAVVVNYSSYPRIVRNNFDRNEMSVRLEKFQSGDWEERAGSPALTEGEAIRRGSKNPNIGQAMRQADYPKRVYAKGNYWGPDAGRDPSMGTLGKIWDGHKYGPVKYEGFGEEEYRIDVVDYSEESAVPFADAGPRAREGARGAK
ncbi:MAG TPA: right-handed parallel beta-helix repeat-containing protein [Candidatus Deferrimicrobiaceae bacterium]